MEKFAISTDSTSDFYAEEYEKYDIYVGRLNYTITKNGETTEYLDYFKTKEDYVNFYNELRGGAVSKTSILNLQAHIDLFTKMAEDGVENAIHISQSMGLSPTATNAEMAIAEIKKKYPKINYVVVESNTTTYAEGKLVLCAMDMREKGFSLEQTVDAINDLKNKFQHFIVVDDLMYLKRGGRVSGPSAVIGTMLSVKPIIEFTKEGTLSIVRKEMGTKKAYKSIIKEIKDNFTFNKDYGDVFVAHTDNEKGAKILADMFEEEFHFRPGFRMIGPIIGTHLGPNAVAIAFISNEQRKYSKETLEN